MKHHIINRFFEGERPLFAQQNIVLEKVNFYPGESALKESSDIEVYECQFMGKYPFWHNENTLIQDSLFTIYSRAAIWYSKNIRMKNTIVEAPKMFRSVKGLYLEKVKLFNAGECCWNCEDLQFVDVEVKGGDYIFMNCKNITLEDFKLQGNYSFQDAKNVIVRNAYLDSKDAFWNTENVTVYNSVIIGEYLGWYSKNLKLVNCTIQGTQPLCYANGLVLENCTMQDTDLCFEYSDVRAEINTHIISIKNPSGGFIFAKSIGEIIIDENCKNPGLCTIKTKKETCCCA